MVFSTCSLWALTFRLHLIDFEQLKIENQTVNEKIEERNEELLKLRKKNTTTVQVITNFEASGFLSENRPAQFWG